MHLDVWPCQPIAHCFMLQAPCLSAVTVYYKTGHSARGWLSAGTNFLMRAKAFMEVGGSPTYTLTEDFALGMELKKYGWQCRYVQEYLAVGEAPDQIRNCFQQRSRWTKVRCSARSAGGQVALSLGFEAV